jgi:uncharacterized membrane protein
MRDRHPLQVAALASGALFLIVGVLGFVPGVTSHYSELEFAGHESDALLLGVFRVSILHNIVHLLFGVLGVLAARTVRDSRTFLIGGGVAYLLLTVYGVAIDHGSDVNIVPINSADNWLHLVLAIAMIGAGVALGRTRPRVTT